MNVFMKYMRAKKPLAQNMTFLTMSFPKKGIKRSPNIATTQNITAKTNININFSFRVVYKYLHIEKKKIDFLMIIF